MTKLTIKEDLSGEQSSSDCTVVILCGGKGTRLRPLTNEQPKGMVSVGGKPMLEHILHQYQRYGYHRFVICIGYRGEVIQNYFAHLPAGVTIQFSDAGEEASMLQRLWHARPFLSQQIIVSYCDTFIDMNPNNLLEYHNRMAVDITLVTAPIRNPFGVVDADEHGLVDRFEEKPLYDCFIGCYLLQRSTLDNLPPDLLEMSDGSGLVALFSRLAEERRLAAYSHLGIQINFNTVSEHQEAEGALSRYHTCLESS
ncbi:MAG: nucleotidyltransferase family protein [Magnetococcales bacterium]|nr:nucleotidyltransferase family protein [Magnetococcales bacterium]